jgi:adenosylcobinamide-GDP ribazoletransferase
MSLFAVLRFLTILPAPSAGGDETSRVGRSLPLFPLVGLIIGLLLGALYWALRAAFPPPVVAALLVLALAVITGAHHLDGLIDTCDAMVSGRTKGQRLDIMADTRVGAFGIAGVCLLLITKFAAIQYATWFGAIVAFPVISRWTLTASILIFPSAKAQGSGHAVKIAAGWEGFFLATVITAFILVLCTGLIEAAVLMIASLALVLLPGLLFNRLYGGLTGDCYGALVEIGEALALLLMIVQIPFLQSFPGHNLFQLPFLKA